MLADYLNVNRSGKPKLLVDYLHLLCKSVWPDMTEAEFKQILEKRGAEPKKQQSLFDDNADVAAEALDPDELAELEQHLKDVKAWKEPTVKPKAKAKGAARKKATPLLEKKKLTLSDVQAYLPDVAGCHLIQDTW